MIEDTSDGWQRIGAHRVRLDPPDIFFIRWVGSVSTPEFAGIFDATERFFAEHPRLFWLADVSNLVNDASPHSFMLSAEARKLGVERLRTLRFEAIVLIGAQFHHRVLSKLILAAAQILQPSLQIPQVVTFQTEAEARAWIAQERGRLSQPHQR